MKSILKILTCGIAVALMLCLIACGGGKEPDHSGGEPSDTDMKEETLKDFKLTREYFKGKNVIVYGDSITVDSSTSTFVAGGKNYIDLMKDSLGYNLLGNYAVGGTTMTHSVSERPTSATNAKERYSCGRYIAEHQEENAQADFAIIAYGTNDFSLAAALGEKSDSPESWLNVKTFLGGIRYSVNTLRAANPNIKILFLTPLYPSTKPTKPTTLTLTQYADAIESLAEELDYRAVNMYSVFNSSFTAGSAYTKDGLHPNIAGHKVMANYLLALDV